VDRLPRGRTVKAASRVTDDEVVETIAYPGTRSTEPRSTDARIPSRLEPV
jgi:hypothetical protein